MLQKLKKIDGPVIFILVLLMAISIITVYSAGRGPTNLAEHGNDYQKMIGYYILGFVVILGIAVVDFRIFIKKALYVYGGGIFLLALGFFGGTVNNSQGFLKIGGLNLQPAEVFKLVLIIFLTYMLIKKRKSKLYFVQDVLPVALVSFVPFAMVMVQNDLGNALGYIVIVLGMLWIGNVKASHALIGFTIFVVAVGGGLKAYISFHDEIDSFMKGIGRSHWVERLDPWLVPEKATAKASYHTKNAKLAIASGGMMGKGFLQGTSVQSGRVPYTYADSIFVVVAEEFGFVGSSVLLLLYFILIHRMILISLECRDRAGPYLIVGIVSMLLYQIFENIGAFLGIMPLTGITLPFISYGGTSLLINMASIGLVMSIKVHGQELEDDLPQPSRVSLAKEKKA